LFYEGCSLRWGGDKNCTRITPLRVKPDKGRFA
jgi:hypothetical protein